MVVQQHTAIKASLQELNAAVDLYSGTFEKMATSDDPAVMGELSSHQVKMTESVNKMKSSVYGPLNMVTAHFEEVRNLILHSAIALTLR